MLKNLFKKPACAEIVADRIKEWKRDLATHRFEEYPEYPFARKSNALFLHGLGLNEIPLGVRVLRELERLDLGENQLKELPSWIGELSALRALRLSNNQLENLPSEIGSLSRLTALDLRKNQLKMLPIAITALSLRDLMLDENP